MAKWLNLATGRRRLPAVIQNIIPATPQYKIQNTNVHKYAQMHSSTRRYYSQHSAAASQPAGPLPLLAITFHSFDDDDDGDDDDDDDDDDGDDDDGGDDNDNDNDDDDDDHLGTLPTLSPLSPSTKSSSKGESS